MRQELSRRELLRLAGLAAGSLGLSACASSGGDLPIPTSGTPPVTTPRLRLAPVRASWDRVIRTTVGLRPHRPGGFVVRALPRADGVLVHNYGHGGAGMSLAWGTASLAADLAVEASSRQAGVLGCGVVGLTTAIELQRRGFDVTIYAESVPPNTTSNMSWASFTPTSGLSSGGTTDEWQAQFGKAVDIAYRQLQLLVGRGYGVSWIDTYSFRAEAPPARNSQRSRQASALRMPSVVLGPGEHPFPAPYAIQRPTLRIEPSIYLAALVEDFRRAGGRIMIRRFEAPGQLDELTEPVVVNCTGLGSRDLFGDDTLMAVKGQLTVLVPQEEVNYSTFGGIPGQGTNGGFPVHMLPRADGIVLGGTSERDVWTLEPNEEARRQIVEAHIALYAGMR